MKQFVAGKTVIPVSGQQISDQDVEVLHKVVDDRWYTDHKRCSEFRRNLGKYFNKKYVILTNSGSSASLIAMLTAIEKVEQDAKWSDFKYVITTALAFPTTVAPIYQAGKIPLYVDIDPLTLAPNIDQVQDAGDKFLSGIIGAIFTHTLGFPFRESKFSWLFNFLISDCCDGAGAEVFGVPVGSYSDLMTLSFFPAHQICSAEGGAILTNHETWKTIAESYINWGKSCYCLPGNSNSCGQRFTWDKLGDLPEGWDHKYVFDRLGYNLKMTEFQAALGNSQLSSLDEFVITRNANFHFYRHELDKYSEFLQFIVASEDCYPSPFGFPIIVKEDAPFTAQELLYYLEKHKITTRRIFGGNIVWQPAFKNLPRMIYNNLKATDYVANNGFFIGVQPSLTDEMKFYVIDIFEDFFKGL
jgi:CDP-6-deoxy-D-xylo-4-hexulose-3-dehydrase